MDAAAPDDGVFVDVVIEDGVLYLELANLADRPALNVACSFDPPLVDARAGTCPSCVYSAASSFSARDGECARCSTPSPGTSHAMRRRRFAVVVEYERPGAPRSATRVAHDLELYRELAHRI